jgi:hypothetical protein
MASWLPSFEAASEAFNKMSEISNDITNKVQATLADDDLLNKLTLRSEEMVKERSMLDAQEQRKEIVRDYLAEILPWETKDESRLILEEECKKAILELSTRQSTFMTPFELPDGLLMFQARSMDEGDIKKGEATNVNANANEKDGANATENGDKGADAEGDNESGGNSNGNGDVSADIGENDEQKSAGIKLEKMSPLPPLLEHFDLDTHVGLVEKLFREDENLVSMHSTLSGAGEKEVIFWKNYFFHCAYTRYEKGLTIEEIWARKPKAIGITQDVRSSPAKSIATKSNHDAEELYIENLTLDDGDDDDVSIELQFEADGSNAGGGGSGGGDSDNDISNSSSPQKLATSEHKATEEQNSDSSGSGTSYDMIDDSMNMNANSNHDDLVDDLDLDDLEAEIARELGED